MMRLHTKLRQLLLAGAVAALTLAVTACAFEPHASSDVHGQPATASQHFHNNYQDVVPGGFWRWQWERWRSGTPAVPEGGWRFPMRRPDLAYLATNRAQPTVTWIGHATVLLQLGGLNILTDPHFSERASPFSFIGPRRWVPPAIAIAELPHIDVVLVSHNHYDHLDDASVRALAKQAGGPPRFYVPLGLGEWCRRRGITAVTELAWWDARDDRALKIHLVPVQHWSARTPWDRNETLWGGFVLESGGMRVFFSGDTGYSRDFVEIGRRFAPFDLAILPIGAYEPRWFMGPQHIDPAEAVQIHKDLQARQSLGVHWGTFALSDEPLDEPPRALARALDAAHVNRTAFWVFEHGETRGITTRRPESPDVGQARSSPVAVSSAQPNSTQRP